ncbi:hypothetical protein BGX38DRAFT_1144811 [Terfezia claveryi]|nr:hypothetical protein BGX38DRAFT_1144811 [Terfezia claveryi]
MEEVQEVKEKEKENKNKGGKGGRPRGESQRMFKTTLELEKKTSGQTTEDEIVQKSVELLCQPGYRALFCNNSKCGIVHYTAANNATSTRFPTEITYIQTLFSTTPLSPRTHPGKPSQQSPHQPPPPPKPEYSTRN